MKVTIQQEPSEKLYILQNMWIAYAHEVSQYQDDLPNMHGLMGEKDDTYDPEFMAEWWEHPEGTFVYFVYVDNRLAGFALIAAPPLVDGDADWELTEFFLFYPYRGQGIGRQAAIQLFDSFQGLWQLSVMNKDDTAMAFWKKVLPAYAQEISTKQTRAGNNVPMTEFVFSSVRN